MARTATTKRENGDPALLRTEWLASLAKLTSLVKSWATELDWSTREIQERMTDSRLGTLQTPALLMQKETTRVLLDPIARFTPGADGVVDLYLMPAYDDIASLYLMNGDWRLHYIFPGDTSAATIRNAESTPLSKEALERVLDEMTANAPEPLRHLSNSESGPYTSIHESAANTSAIDRFT